MRYCGRQRVVDEGVDGAREDKEGAKAEKEHEFKEVEEQQQTHEPDLRGGGMREWLSRSEGLNRQP